MNWKEHKSEIQSINLPLLIEKEIQLSIMREDLIHPEISGNKYRKLKYNLIEAKKLGYKKIITFGGAFSNHIAACAAAANQNNLESIGIIRGEEIEELIDQNPTLSFARKQGMEFRFISREQYREKDSEKFLTELKNQYPDYYIIPEGGTNSLAIQGCEEILHQETNSYNYITTAIGTGGTIAGLINSTHDLQHVIGFPALKGDFFYEEIRKLTNKNNFSILNDYHFGGYGKIKDELIEFINQFKTQHHIALDPIYTGKMMYGILDLIQKDYFKKGSKILAIHTGGLQGIHGINEVLKKKNKTIII